MPQLADELDLCSQLHQAADDQRILALGVRQADHQTVVHRLDVLHKGQGAQSYQPGRIHLCQVENDLASVQFGAQILRGVHRDQAGFENANAVAQSVSFVQVVGAQEDGASQRFELLDKITYKLAKMDRLRSALKRSYMPGDSVKMPTVRRMFWSSLPTSQRPMKARPAVGPIRLVSMRTVVVLPAPFGPRKPNTSPSRTSRVKSCTARIGCCPLRVVKYLDNCSVRIIFVLRIVKRNTCIIRTPPDN